MATLTERAVTIELTEIISIEGDLAVPEAPVGVVLFAHGSGSSRHSPRNKMVAAFLQEQNLATLLVDLLTNEEELVDMRTRHLRFDVDLLARRLDAAAGWVRFQPELAGLSVGYFGASTGAAAALIAAAEHPDGIGAIVSRGGRPDLAAGHLPRVRAPVLLLVGGRDQVVLDLNRKAQSRLRAPSRLTIVPGATHLFEEPGALEAVARSAGAWLQEHLDPR